jgi:hypothetical protein
MGIMALAEARIAAGASRPLSLVTMVIRPPAIDREILLSRSSPGLAVVTGIPGLDSVLSGLLGLPAWPGA